MIAQEDTNLDSPQASDQFLRWGDRSRTRLWRSSYTGKGAMSATIIENPIINSPFAEPDRHFRFDDDGITSEIESGRRPSSYFVPIAQPKKKGPKQIALNLEPTADRIKENPTVNAIRRRVNLWRQQGYFGVTPTTAKLLEYWTNPEREKRLFFCQIE